ncbi:MAG: hypothetical protein M0C28_47505 [Candidatus Moduliflexus flocculans]|nr:hypothetical protein [Candidatus Moduliflexus flocculans]
MGARPAGAGRDRAEVDPWNMKPLPELDRICAAFDCPGVWVSSCPIPSGHINDTYCSRVRRRRPAVPTLRQPAHQPPRLPRPRAAHGATSSG